MHATITTHHYRRYARKIIYGLAAFALLLASASGAIAGQPGWEGTARDQGLQGEQEEIEFHGSINPIIVVPCYSKPDLTVASLPEPIWDATNQRTIIQAVILNRGGVATPANLNFLVRLYADGRAYQFFTSPLAAGASRTVRFTLNYWIYNPDASYRVMVDPAGVVAECNESNNYADFFEIG